MVDPLIQAWSAARPALRLAWPSIDVVIPDLQLLRRRDDGRPVRVFFWLDTVHTLLVPDAADVGVLRPDPARGATFAPRAIPRADLLALAGDQARPFADPVPHHLVRLAGLGPRLRTAGEDARGKLGP